MIGKRVAPGRAEESKWTFNGGLLALFGGGRAVISHKAKDIYTVGPVIYAGTGINLFTAGSQTNPVPVFCQLRRQIPC